MRIFIMGIMGKMGKLLVEKIDSETSLHVIGGGDTEKTKIGKIKVACEPDQIFSLINEANLVVDFSYPTGTEIAVEACLKNGVPLVTGTTGLLPAQQAKIGELSKIAPVVQAANFSAGITLLMEFNRIASSILTDAECEIVEKHHRNKKDSPSGTALALGKITANAKKMDFDANAQYGRKGTNIERKTEIGIHSLRGGNIIGDHEVNFILDNEVLTLSHRACNREIFTDGAIQAIYFIANKKSGLFGMRDVIGLKM